MISISLVKCTCPGGKQFPWLQRRHRPPHLSFFSRQVLCPAPPHFDMSVRKVISGWIFGSVFRFETRSDRGRLSCMTVDPLSRSATIKDEASRGIGTNVHRPTAPPQTLTAKTDQRGAEARGLTPPRLRHPNDDRRPRRRPTPTPCLHPHRPKVHPRSP
jgi:hypothetical protein